MTAAFMPSLHTGNRLVLDDVHSFVLRVHLNPAPGGRGIPRPQFNLEDVNEGTSQRMQNLDEVLQELASRIELILHSANGRMQ